MKKSLLGVSLITLTGLYCFFFAFIFLIGLLLGAKMSYMILGAIIVLRALLSVLIHYEVKSEKEHDPDNKDISKAEF